MNTRIKRIYEQTVQTDAGPMSKETIDAIRNTAKVSNMSNDNEVRRLEGKKSVFGNYPKTSSEEARHALYAKQKDSSIPSDNSSEIVFAKPSDKPQQKAITQIPDQPASTSVSSSHSASDMGDAEKERQTRQASAISDDNEARRLDGKKSKWYDNVINQVSNNASKVGKHISDNAVPYGVGIGTVAAGLGAYKLYKNRQKNKKSVK